MSDYALDISRLFFINIVINFYNTSYATSCTCRFSSFSTIHNDLGGVSVYRKYGSTFYIGIAMVILPYFGHMGKLKLQFSLSVSTQFDLYHHQSGEHVES